MKKNKAKQEKNEAKRKKIDDCEARDFSPIKINKARNKKHFVYRYFF